MLDYIKNVLDNMPADWLNLTTHRLDVYDESLAKKQFLDQFHSLFESNNANAEAFSALPTAYDYIRLGHPLSCVLEWTVASLNSIKPEQVIGFASKTAPILAILRKNLLANKKTQICYMGELPSSFDAQILQDVYGYSFDLIQVDSVEDIVEFSGSTVLISQKKDICQFELTSKVDFFINTQPQLGSIVVVNGEQNDVYVSEIQHVRRRETIAMTPENCMAALTYLTSQSTESAVSSFDTHALASNKSDVLDNIKTITGTELSPLVASSGLSIQYAIMMGLVHDALENHAGKAIKIIVPPNCYGGTNDQARRVAACIDNVDVVDLPVDGDNDMVSSIDTVLSQIANEDAVPYIVAEIPTNPRVEVPELIQLEATLSAERHTANGDLAIAPVFILDQTFCPNVLFLGEGEILSKVKTISYVSGSKFPSGGKCTAGYCVGNNQTASLMEKVALHLSIFDNEATSQQYQILAKQLPSMNQRIYDAYKNTREFVNYIQQTLPEAKINFVSEEVTQQGFTPSVFSLDLPTKGDTPQEREEYKRNLNLKLIDLMITEIPNESKHCVSYGQLKGCYWTVPATSTQGTTKEADKDYIARVALSPDMDLERHKQVFLDFVNSI